MIVNLEVGLRISEKKKQFLNFLFMVQPNPSQSTESNSWWKGGGGVSKLQIVKTERSLVLF